MPYSGCPSDEALAQFADGVGDRAGVVSHVEKCANCRKTISALIAARSGLSLTLGSPPSSQRLLARKDRLEPGSVLGRYVVIAHLGEGGMGVVWAAWDPELKRRVALKLLHRADPEAQARLQREAQAMARLSHPNVVSVFDMGAFGGETYLALEMVEGETLATWQRGRTTQEVLRAYRDAAAGLQAVQAAGILHRDFKPQNVLVDTSGRVRVTDFGLARVDLAQEDDTGSTGATDASAALSVEGQVLGTPMYMAPEQLLGQRVDARADQFSFCASLFEGLYGERPFQPRSLSELRAQHLAGARLPAGPRAAQVPKRVAQTVLRGLSYRADDRFPSLDALLQALAPTRSRAPSLLGVSAALALTAGASWAWHRAHLCVGARDQLIGVWDAPTRSAFVEHLRGLHKPWAEDAARLTSAALDRYADGWAAMHQEACEATSVRGDQSDRDLSLRMTCLQVRRRELGALVSQLTKGDETVAAQGAAAVDSLSSLKKCADLSALSANSMTPEPAARAEVDALEQRLAELNAMYLSGDFKAGRAGSLETLTRASALHFPPVEARAAYLAGLFEANVGDASHAAELLEKGALAAELSGDLSMLAEARIRLVYVTGFTLTKYELAHQWAPMAEIAVKKAGSQEAHVGALEEALGMLDLSQGKHEAAEAHFRAAIATLAAAFGESDQRTLRAKGNLVSVLRRRAQFASAITTSREVISGIEASVGALHPMMGRAQGNLASVFVEAGQFDEALAASDRATAILEESLGPSNGDFGMVLLTRAAILGKLGRRDDSALTAQKGLAVLEEAYGKDSPRVAAACNTVGSRLSEAGRFEEAEHVFRRALAIQLERNGPLHPDLTTTYFNLGQVLARQHQFDGALEAHRQMLTVSLKANGPEHPRTLLARSAVAEDLGLAGKCRAALPEFEQTLALREKVLGPAHADLAPTLTGLARCQLEFHRVKEARGLLERAVAVRATSLNPSERAEQQWLLGRLLVEASIDPKRGRTLVREALSGFDKSQEDEAKLARAWTLTH